MVFIVLLLSVLAFIGLFVVKAMSPDAFQSLLITFQLNPQSAEEQARLDKIRLLAVSDEKKRILTNRTIFLGASTSMVELALGKPIAAEHFSEYQPEIDRWVYHFADDSRPTVLEFHDNKLASAYKVSAYRLKQAEQKQPTAPAPAPVPVPAPAAQ